MGGVNQSPTEHRSESKKRCSMEIKETSETSQKRVKMRDLESVFRSEGRGGNDAATPDSRVIDLNVHVGSASCVVGVDDPACVDESNNLPASEKEDMQNIDGIMKARGFDLDLNAADVSSSINESMYPCKMHEHLRSKDDSDCVSSVGPLDTKDPMRVWKGLKQNNYLSTPYGAPPVAMPKVRGRKKSSSNDVMKKKIELAKKEQVDRFARVAAPSGLLNGLNPGIINHVRNSKQVHSIIEALVRSKKDESLHSGNRKRNQIKTGAHDLSERREAMNVRGLGGQMSGLAYGDALLGRRQMSDYAFFAKSVYPNTEITRGDSDSHMGYTRSYPRVTSCCAKGNEDDRLPLKLSSSVAVCTENASCLSSEESANISSVTSLSLKAANVASQWLELLHQDIRGRLAALRRSKKRVRAVITTELPLLISGEFSSNLENDIQIINSTASHFDQATADAHSVRWSTIFGQMDKALSEEEGHLENWLNQVKEMQSHCEIGLNTNSLHHPLDQAVPPGYDFRSGTAENSDKDLAVRAAAASIYSTCNFLLSRENSPCC
ncbi:uncharacterized protein LOC130997182 isoform X1 [Salvia miltiorrhiza]|uniref:uncharacterized protein LOC130997182 isoform X1 n=2 Tax=Salvia miltiorrhiza TaxID=226208 RepID=UPI0025ACD4C0|nr:uncharacterized protein LOC130997182 isoform X1 [Salvia miltiorrhiza]